MEYWIWLTQIPGVGTVLEKRLLNHYKSPQAVYEACEEELLSVEGIGTSLAKNIQKHRSLEEAKRFLDQALNQDIKLLTYDDPLYPAAAKEYLEAPILLYYRGSLEINSTGVAIVGSRRCTDYGKQVAVQAADFLARKGIAVISGMAKGIDGYAHTACLKAGGYTIAFLGNGVDICYPREHDALLAGIIENGAVISAYPPGTRPRPEYFPARNALISSWSQKVFVVEAAENSGALITARFAREQGSEVYALPHEINNPTGKGVNRLISEGAHIYLHPAQLLPDHNSREIKPDRESIPFTHEKVSNEIKLTNETSSTIERTLTPIEQKILSSLSITPKTIEEISADTGLDQIQLIELLSMLEIEGLIQTYPGGRYKMSQRDEHQAIKLSNFKIN